MSESKALLKWRSRQKPGAIMSKKTFARIARSYGGARGARIAGAAYWRTAEAKFKKRHK